MEMYGKCIRKIIQLNFSKNNATIELNLMYNIFL